MRRPFMHTAEQRSGLEGQQYLVLRPTASVADAYREIQDAALLRVGTPTRHPHTGHVTLRGFSEPERREELGALIRAWAQQQEPLDLVAEAVDEFPTPWQILIVRLARTASLVSAYATLTAALERTDFRRLDELPLEDWTFHLSLLYGKTLEAARWTRFAQESSRALTALPTEVVAEAEFVWYQDGVEHAEVVPLGA